jgi:magnesium chelatase family protein
MCINLDDIDYKNLISENSVVTKKYISNFLKNIERVRKINKTRPKGGEVYLSNQIIKNQPEIKMMLDTIAEKLKLSARGYFKVLKIARTIADLERSENIKEKHLMEALQYRPNI